MRIDRIAAGDIVLAAVGGRRIYGEVTEVRDGVVYFRPISPAAGWRHASAHEIAAHWRKSGRRSAVDDEAAPRPPREQLSLPIHT